MQYFKPAGFFTLLILLCSPVIHLNAQEWKDLFNGKDLTGWDTWLGPQYDTAIKKRRPETALGLNNDPDRVFTIVQVDGKPAIRISGQHFGGISTTEEFENYHLQVEFKWGTQRWVPRADKKRDSGILYHAVGKHGADGGHWMRSQEFQVQEGDCGDFWAIDGTMFDIHATKLKEKEYVYDPKGPLTTFHVKQEVGRRCIKSPDAEKPSGEWNTVDIYCYGDTAVHVVNGKVVMVLYKSRQTEGGQILPLTKGKIQIQSEGAEVFYRNIRVEPLKKMPKKLI